MFPIPILGGACGASGASGAVAALLLWPCMAGAALGYDEALQLAREQAPMVQMQQHALASARAAQGPAAALPDPRLTLGVDNLPTSGADRLSLTRDFMTMQRIGLMQEVPNAAKRQARAVGAQARVEREAALLAAAQLAARREAALAWLGVHFAERKIAALADLDRENQLVQDTLEARIASGKSMPSDRLMARQEALALADRRDDAARDVSRARAALRRWAGARAEDPLEGDPPAEVFEPAPQAAELRATLHQHAEITPYAATAAVARAELGEADAAQRGDWAWEVVYSRRGPQYSDMVSFQLSFDLPWRRAERLRPLVDAKREEVQRIEAEREDLLRRHEEALAEQRLQWQAFDTQRQRLKSQGLPLAAERVRLALASYEAGRGDLAAVLTARREAVETRLRGIGLDEQCASLRLRLTTWIAEP